MIIYNFLIIGRRYTMSNKKENKVTDKGNANPKQVEESKKKLFSLSQ